MFDEFGSIKEFFLNKNDASGNPIEVDRLLTDYNLRLLKYLELIPALEVVSAAKEEDGFAVTFFETDFVLSVLYECENKKIPQNFIPGIMLLARRECEACDFDYIDWADLIPKSMYNKIHIV